MKKWEQPLTARGIYLVLLLLLAVALLLPKGIRMSECLSPVVLARSLFVVGAFSLYLLLYGWYFPIGRGDRFMGSLWIPCIFLACHLGCRALASSANPSRMTLFVAAHLLILASLALQSANLLALLYGGTIPSLKN